MPASVSVVVPALNCVVLGSQHALYYLHVEARRDGQVLTC